MRSFWELDQGFRRWYPRLAELEGFPVFEEVVLFLSDRTVRESAELLSVAEAEPGPEVYGVPPDFRPVPLDLPSQAVRGE